MLLAKERKRRSRHKRIRVRIKGTAQTPRLAVSRGLKNMQVQLIDDCPMSKTILSLSTTAKEMKEKIGYGGNLKAAMELGEAVAKLAVNKGIRRIVFDRCGYAYHGRVKALAEALRKGGLVF